ncbi:hypothetical protein ES703_102548 [subsurface metagenome]
MVAHTGLAVSYPLSVFTLKIVLRCLQLISHFVRKSETLGTILLLSGLAVYNGWELSTLKILFIVVFVLIANPTATHAISRAAFRSGLQPWTRKKKNNGEVNKSDK